MAAEKEISDLTEASTLNSDDLLLVQQYRVAKKLPWKILLAMLTQRYAPAGYGLGDNYGAVVSDLNLVTKPGFYCLAGSNTQNNPPLMTNSGYGVLLVESRWDIIQQTVKRDNHIAIRNGDYNGNWNEWEYVNPPMVPGVEYRTTERWNGKAVYTKLINCGKGSTGLTEITHSTSMTKILRCAGTLGGVWALPFFSPNGLNDPHTYWCNATYYLIQIYAGAGTDISSYDVYVQIWYTKD